jgi:hypothetical protein
MRCAWRVDQIGRHRGIVLRSLSSASGSANGSSTVPRGDKVGCRRLQCGVPPRIEAHRLTGSRVPAGQVGSSRCLAPPGITPHREPSNLSAARIVGRPTVRAGNRTACCGVTPHGEASCLLAGCIIRPTADRTRRLRHGRRLLTPALDASCLPAGCTVRVGHTAPDGYAVAVGHAARVGYAVVVDQAVRVGYAVRVGRTVQVGYASRVGAGGCSGGWWGCADWWVGVWRLWAGAAGVVGGWVGPGGAGDPDDAVGDGDGPVAGVQVDVVSRRREFHPPPLSEPCVTLSRHTAPTVEPVGSAPCRQCAKVPG